MFLQLYYAKEREKLLQPSFAREGELDVPGGRRDCTRCNWAPADRAARGLQSASLRIHRVPLLSRTVNVERRWWRERRKKGSRETS